MLFVETTSFDGQAGYMVRLRVASMRPNDLVFVLWLGVALVLLEGLEHGVYVACVCDCVCVCVCVYVYVKMIVCGWVRVYVCVYV